MSKKYLNQEIKEFIVKELAYRQRPSDIAVRVKEKFGVEIKRQTAHLYDPTRQAGKDLSKPLKELFRRERAEYNRQEKIRTDEMIQEKIRRIYPHAFP